jgi:hypothetical protein
MVPEHDAACQQHFQPDLHAAGIAWPTTSPTTKQHDTHALRGRSGRSRARPVGKKRRSHLHTWHTPH